MALPNPGMTIDPARTALVVTDPQNDFLSPDGVMWQVVGKSVTENDTVEHIESLFKAAKEAGLPVSDRCLQDAIRCAEFGESPPRR